MALLVALLLAGWMAWRRWRVSVIVMLAGSAVAVALFTYDAATHNWQLHAERYNVQHSEKTFYYFTWWWYDQRWLGQ